jgi:hypothetical protein
VPIFCSGTGLHEPVEVEPVPLISAAYRAGSVSADVESQNGYVALLRRRTGTWTT